MKKLMMMLVVAAAAICSQAGTVTWAAANVYDGAAKVTSGDYIGILCLFNAGTGVSNTDLADYLSAEHTTAEKIAMINSAAVSGSQVKSNALGGFNNGPQAAADAGTYKAYAIFFDVNAMSAITDDTHYMISSLAATDAVVPASGNKLVAIGNQQSTTQGVAWSSLQAVPEPTSGLLLLLGMAGLALRRRRA